MPTFDPKTYKNDKNDGDRTYVEEPGTYNAKVAWVESKTSQKGNAYVQFRLEIVGGKFSGANVYDSFGTSEASYWKWKEIAFATGHLHPFNPEILSQVQEAFRGKQVTVEVIMETYRGKTKSKPKHYVPQAGLADQAFEDAGLEEEATPQADDGFIPTDDAPDDVFNDDDIPF